MSSDGVRTESLDPRERDEGASLHAGEVVLDRYRVERPIGRGGMGEVYEATHITLGSRVALKLPLGKNPSGRGAARLLREAQLAASLDPDRVVRVLDVGVLGDGRPVIVLERLEGETLAERIERERRLDVVAAVDFTIGACLGLAEAHARGIVHRDVKPSNLFLAKRRDGTRVVKVLDFGVAALRASGETEDTRLTDSRAPVGSPPYMAPEQLRSREVDARTDVWGLGVTLFELLAGRLPFDGPSAAAVSAAIVADEPAELRTLREDVPDGLADVVRKCLTKGPAERPADALALARELAPFASSSERAQVLAQASAAALPNESLGQTNLSSASAVIATRGTVTGPVAPRSRRLVSVLAIAGVVTTVVVVLAARARSNAETAATSAPVTRPAAAEEARASATAPPAAAQTTAPSPTTSSQTASSSAELLTSTTAPPRPVKTSAKVPKAQASPPIASDPPPPRPTTILDERKF